MNMTDEEIISAAEATGLKLFGLGMDKAKFEFCILAFAKFVGKIERFKEREACAKLCESEWGKGYRDDGGDAWLTHDNAVHACAAVIRARGEQA
jgi:hypothetical protein